MTFNIRTYIERWYRTFKDGTKRFYSNFGIRDDEKAIEGVEGFVNLFAYWHNHMRPHETLGGTNSIQLVLTVHTGHAGIYIRNILHKES
jgi:hypothetical protein